MDDGSVDGINGSVDGVDGSVDGTVALSVLASCDVTVDVLSVDADVAVLAEDVAVACLLMGDVNSVPSTDVSVLDVVVSATVVKSAVVGVANGSVLDTAVDDADCVADGCVKH